MDIVITDWVEDLLLLLHLILCSQSAAQILFYFILFFCLKVFIKYKTYKIELCVNWGSFAGEMLCSWHRGWGYKMSPEGPKRKQREVSKIASADVSWFGLNWFQRLQIETGKQLWLCYVQKRRWPTSHLWLCLVLRWITDKIVSCCCCSFKKTKQKKNKSYLLLCCIKSDPFFQKLSTVSLTATGLEC